MQLSSKASKDWEPVTEGMGHPWFCCVFCFRFYRRQLFAPSEEDARSGAAVWPPPSLPGEKTRERL